MSKNDLNENAYGEDIDDDTNNDIATKIKEAKKKKKPRIKQIKTNDDNNNDKDNDKKMNKKAKTENNNAMLETLGVQANSSRRQKANVYLNSDTMDKLKTLSSLSNKSIASLVETILINNLTDVEIIEDEVKRYDESNKNRKRK